MAKVSVVPVAKAIELDSSEIRVRGEVESRAYLKDPTQPLHLAEHRLAADASISLTARRANAILFVWLGEVCANDVALAAKSCAVIERGASLALQAGARGATVLVFDAPSSDYPDDAARGGRPGVHLLPADRAARSDSLGGRSGIGGALYADSRIPVANVWLHETNWTAGDEETALHSHSEDEVIFVIEGSIRLGNRLYGPGTALAITADVIYGFRTGPDGLAFVNFRAASPTYSPRGGSPQDESDLWGRLLGRPAYLPRQVTPGRIFSRAIRLLTEACLDRARQSGCA